ncbi:CG12857, partial [Drosophila busckii]
LVAKAEDLELGLERVSSQQANKDLSHSLFEFGHNFEDVENWLSFEQPTKTSLTQVLRYMIENHLKTNVQINIDKVNFNCHSVVLQVYSKFFSELEPMPLVITLPMEKVSQKTFLVIYKWMLSDEPKLERKDIIPVFVAASYLRIEALLQQCWQYFENPKCFNEDTACLLYVEARGDAALDIVRNLMLTRICKFMLIFVASRDFLDVPVTHLSFLLSSDDICVNTEIEILFIITRWLGHDWKGRQSHALNLISCIRFHLMPLWYLLCVRRTEEHKLLQKLLNHPSVAAKINQAISQHTSTMYEEQLAGQKMDHMNILKSAQPRKWLLDNECPYFHHISCPCTNSIEFKQFEFYLSILQKKPHNYWQQIEYLDVNNPKMCDC